MHWRKSERFHAAAVHDLMGGHWEASCSNSVLAAIHAADAVSLHYRNMRSASNNHDDAVELVNQIQELDPEARFRFVKHLDALLDVKTLVQYSSRQYGKKDAGAALKHLERALSALEPTAIRAGWID